MGKAWLVLGIITVAALIAIYLLWLYNSIVKARNMTEESWSGVDVQLKRRRDLVPNLVATVQGYAGHENQTLVTLAEDRIVADSASHGGPGTAVPAENRLTNSLRGLFAVVEQYPQLKADQNFMQLQKELINIENNVAGSRAIYNSNARAYNDKIQSFPANLFAATFGFRPRPYVEAAARERGAAQVLFAR